MMVRAAWEPANLLRFPHVEHNGINEVHNLAAPRMFGSARTLRDPFLEAFNMPEYSCRTVEIGARLSLHVVALRRVVLDLAGRFR